MTDVSARSDLTAFPAHARERALTVRHHGPSGGRVILHVILIIGAILMLVPFLLELLISFETLADSQAVPLTLIPRPWVWSNYTQVFKVLPFAHMLGNTVLLTIARTGGQVVFCSLAGYAFARLRFRGSGVLFGLFLSVLMIPSQLLILPQYEIMSGLHLLNTVPALFLPGMFSAFGTFLMRQFFLQLPRDIADAAYIDGAGPGRTFFYIMLPMARSGLIALAILTIIWSWNDLLWPLIVSTNETSMPVSVGLASLQGEYSTNYPVLMAGSVLASLPLIIIFLLFQKHFINGIALGALKG